MNPSADTVGATTQPQSEKPFITKSERFFLYTLLLIEALAATAWFQSHFFPYENIWYDPKSNGGGLTRSARGQFMTQRCSITRVNLPGGPPPGSAAQSQDEILIGSSQHGPRTPIRYGDLTLTFVDPQLQGFGFNTGQKGGPVGSAQMTFAWNEDFISYPFLMVAVLIFLLIGLCDIPIRWFRKRFLTPHL
jgi:hypothetical protein